MKTRETFTVLILIVLVFFGCESINDTNGYATEGGEFYTENLKPEDVTAHFNPQPEPPARIFEIQTLGMPDDDWEGRFLNDHLDGRISVETISSVQRGRTLHLVQLWTLHPPEPVFPVKMTLRGFLNSANGNIVMNGLTEADGMMIKKGTKVHVRAQFTAAGSGAVSAGGEIMFNPQPEPPARGQ